MDVWIGVGALVVGLVSCFYGYPLFRILLVLAGLIIGYGLGQTLVSGGHPWLSLGVGLLAAVVLALFAYPLWSVGVVLSGGALGFLIFGALASAFSASQLVILLVGAVGAFIIGLLFYQAKDLFVMLTSALNGAVEVVFGLGWLLPVPFFRRGEANLLAFLAIVVLGAVGFAVQYGMFKDRRTYSETPPAREER